MTQWHLKILESIFLVQNPVEPRFSVVMAGEPKSGDSWEHSFPEG
jgi:hypothetical protein